MTLVEAYLTAAHSAAALVAEPTVAARWGEPSALVGCTVGGLAEHLAGQVFSVATATAEPPSTYELIPLLEHYARATWVGADRDAEINVAIRGRGEDAAAEGHGMLTARLAGALAEVTRGLPTLPADRWIKPPAGPWSLTLDDFLTTRMMEIAAHSDDLAHSVGVPTPTLPESVEDPVFRLLLRLAVRRHGSAAVLRALTRVERAPASIAAF